MPLEGEQLGFLEKVILIVEKYGLFRIFKALFVMAVFIYVMYNAQNFDSIIKEIVKTEMESHNDDMKTEHDAAMEVRRNVDSKIQSILKEILLKTDADRVFVMEFHNGNNNTSGLPFIYGELTYEVEAAGIASVADDYNNLNLSRFTFPTYLESKQMWIGEIEELANVDTRLSKRLSSNDVTYFAIIRLHGLNNPLGYMGISYCNGKTHDDSTELEMEMVRAGQQLSSLLDVSNNNTI